MTSTLMELRQAVRRLLASPTYSAGVFLTLTLGLALSAGMYTILNGGDGRLALAGVFAVSLVVLAIACANVGSLLAARLASRENELAILQALGATSERVWRGVLMELVLATALACATALLILWLGLEAFRAASAGILPRIEDVRLDPEVLGFATLLALLCPLLVAVPFGLSLRKRMAGNVRVGGKHTGAARGSVLHVLPVLGLALATSALIAGAAIALSLGPARRRGGRRGCSRWRRCGTSEGATAWRQ